MRPSHLFGTLVAIAAFGATLAPAQETLDLRKMATQMRRNQEEIRQYSWEEKITFEVDGKQRRVDHYTVRYVMGGMLERMQTNSEVSKEKLRRPDGSKLKKKELEAARAFALDVKKQLDGYLNPLFAEKIVATSTVTTADGEHVLRSSGVIASSDEVVVTLSQSTLKPKTMTVKTTVDGSPVGLDIEFGSIDYGPNHVANSVTRAQWQGIALAIHTESWNYEQKGR